MQACEPDHNSDSATDVTRETDEQAGSLQAHARLLDDRGPQSPVKLLHFSPRLLGTAGEVSSDTADRPLGPILDRVYMDDLCLIRVCTMDGFQPGAACTRDTG